MTSSPRSLTYVLALILTLSSLGCAAKDKHVFVSTVNLPTTIVLLDTYTSEAAWEMDIPVNHKLVLDFEGTASGQSADGVSPSWVNWKLYRADDLPTDTGRARKGKLIDSDRVDLTGMKILMKTSFRPSPEIPGSIDAAPIPVRKTTQAVAVEAIAESKAQNIDEEVAEAPAVEEEAVEVEAAEEATMDAVEEANEEAIEAVEEAIEVAEDVEEAVEATEDVSVEDEVADAVEAAVEEAATQPNK